MLDILNTPLFETNSYYPSKVGLNIGSDKSTSNVESILTVILKLLKFDTTWLYSSTRAK